MTLLLSGHYQAMSQHFMARKSPDDHLLIWVTGGRGFAQMADRRIDVEPGSLLLFDPGVPHEYGNDPRPGGAWDILWAHFTGPAASAAFTELRRAGDNPLRVPLPVDATIAQRFHELVAAQHLLGGDEPHHRYLHGCLLIGLIGLMTHRAHLARQPAAPDRFDQAQKLQAYVEAHLREPIRVEDLAKTVHLSPRQLSRRFGELFGVSPMRYVIDQRLAKAASMLEQTTMPVKQVAFTVGFEDAAHFCRLFARSTGKPPTAYRDAMRPRPGTP